MELARGLRTSMAPTVSRAGESHSAPPKQQLSDLAFDIMYISPPLAAPLFL